VAKVAAQYEVLADRQELGNPSRELHERVLTEQIGARVRGVELEQEAVFGSERLERSGSIDALVVLVGRADRSGARRHGDLRLVHIRADRPERVDVAAAYAERVVRAEPLHAGDVLVGA